MSEQEKLQTAGTTSQYGTDAALAAGGTPAEAGRDAGGLTPEQELEKLRAERNLWLQSKTKVEGYNDLERRLKDVELERDALAARSQPTYGAVDPRVAQQQQALENLQVAIQEAQHNAANGDRQAALLVSLLQNQYSQQQFITNQLQLQQIPVEDRKAVESKMATNLFANPDAAYKAVLGERYLSERDTLSAQQKELERQLAARKTGVVGTGAVIPVTARQVDAASANELTRAEFVTEHARIMQEQGPEAAREFARRALPGNGLTVK